MSIYKVVSESQIKRLRQLGYQIVPIAGTVLVPGAAEEWGATIPLDNIGAPVGFSVGDLPADPMPGNMAPLAVIAKGERIEVVAPPHISPETPAGPDPVSDSPETPEASHAPNLGDLEARHRGNGSYSVMRGDEELVEGLNRHDAGVFNATNADGKAAFLAARGVAL